MRMHSSPSAKDFSWSCIWEGGKKKGAREVSSSKVWVCVVVSSKFGWVLCGQEERRVRGMRELLPSRTRERGSTIAPSSLADT